MDMQSQMPLFASTDVVWALTIKTITPTKEREGVAPVSHVAFEEENYAPIAVTAAFLKSQNAEEGDKFVLSQGGTRSVMSAEDFAMKFKAI